MRTRHVVFNFYTCSSVLGLWKFGKWNFRKSWIKLIIESSGKLPQRLTDLVDSDNTCLNWKIRKSLWTWRFYSQLNVRSRYLKHKNDTDNNILNTKCIFSTLNKVEFQEIGTLSELLAQWPSSKETGTFSTISKILKKAT